MKQFYPYFNLFVKKGTQDYRLDVLIKLPGKYKLDAIRQEWSDPYWLVKFYFEVQPDLEKNADVQLQEYSVNLTPKDVKQLDKIKIQVSDNSVLDKIVDPIDPIGGGKTGSGDGELEP